MSYSAQAILSADGDFWNRVAACASVEVPMTHSPTVWATEHIWRIAASPGFADAYEYALNTNVERPGNDPAVITDAQILATVQYVISQEA
jgi:hypothetical protein